jgi:hypothetical protein
VGPRPGSPPAAQRVCLVEDETAPGQEPREALSRTPEILPGVAERPGEISCRPPPPRWGRTPRRRCGPRASGRGTRRLACRSCASCPPPASAPWRPRPRRIRRPTP